MSSSPAPLYDLRELFRHIGAPQGGGLTAAPIERNDFTARVEVVDARCEKLAGPPLPVHAFVDGVQSSLVLTYREHRPVYLAYQAAGAVGSGARLVGLRERLAIIASVADTDWVAARNAGARPVPVQTLTSTRPFDVERDAYQAVGDWRDRLERELVEELVATAPEALVVDGSLRDRPNEPRLHGVVKDVGSSRYLKDESEVMALPAGWRSSTFCIPAGVGGGRIDRYSCYVRLHDASHRAWNFGMVRLEAYDPSTLTALGVRAMSERQSPRSGDGRWDRHLASVSTTEKVLRSRRPTVFDF